MKINVIPHSVNDYVFYGNHINEGEDRMDKINFKVTVEDVEDFIMTENILYMSEGCKQFLIRLNSDPTHPKYIVETIDRDRGFCVNREFFFENELESAVKFFNNN